MVGPEVEEIFKKDPMHECAVYYRDFMTYTITEFGIPLSQLIRKYAGYLQEWEQESEQSFKSKYPVAAKNGMLRNLFLVQYSRWIVEFQMIIETHWNKGKYTVFYPKVNPYPMLAIIYLSRMVGRLRDLENKHGLDDHHVVDEAADAKHVTNNLDKKNEETNNLDKKNEETKKAAKKVGAYTVAIATGAAVVASATGGAD